MSNTAAVSSAIEKLKNATFILVLAGAGMSADSGLLVFKQINDSDAMKKIKFSYDQISSLDGFCRETDIFMGFWIKALQTYNAATPHEGYTQLKKICDMVTANTTNNNTTNTTNTNTNTNMNTPPPNPVWVCTTNVDGFFERAGFDQRYISEIHGTSRIWQCGGKPNRTSRFPLMTQDRCCDQLFPVPSACLDATVDEGLHSSAPPPPCAFGCGGIARPNVYLFGDGSKFVNSQEVTKEKALSVWLENVQHQLTFDTSKSVVVLEVGCGLRVPSLRRRGEHFVSLLPKDQCTYIRVNPEYPDLTAKAGTCGSIKCGAKEAIEILVASAASMTSQ